jgi:hypothetical protein
MANVKTTAKNNAPMVPNKTPAPTRPAKIPAPDVISTVRAEQNAGNHYGLNGYTGASSVNPGESVISPMAQSLKSASEKGSDAVLDEVIARGTRAAGTSGRLTGEPAGVYEGVGESQLRPVSSKQDVPTTFGHKNPNVGGAPSGKVPATTGASSGAPVRKPQ